MAGSRSPKLDLPQYRGLKPLHKGDKATKTRKGIPNKNGRIVQELVIDAMHKSGSDGKGKDGAIGYLVWLSRKKPDIFGPLVGKIIPKQVDATITAAAVGADGGPKMTAAQLRQQLLDRGYRPPTLIEHDPSLPDDPSVVDAEFTEIEDEAFQTTGEDD
ncbi:MAG: hypothetical protein EHM78_02255 [Myxococcaceae bacterium]|nr:MAG: hypothetical protein EHM78_02255 [Myxococcaceae bacterium]